MKALVTGGAGFIGSHVVRTLIEEGVEVRVLHLPRENLRNLEGLECEKMAGDILDPACCERAVRGCEWVFHMAAIYVLWEPKPGRMRAVNVEGARNVLQASADAGVKKVVYTSSIAAFGGQGLDRDATEESSFAYRDSGEPYALSKYEATQVARECARDGLDVSLVAPCGPVGPGDIGPTPTGRMILATVNLPFFPVIPNVTNFGHVRDMAVGHVLAAKKGKRGESYLLGNENLTIREFGELVMRVTGVRKPMIPVPHALAMLTGHVSLFWSEYVSRRSPRITPAGVRLNRLGLRADCSKAFRELGLPRTPVETAVRDALVWFARNGYVTDTRVARRLFEISSS